GRYGALESAIEQLEGLPLGYRDLERYVLPARVHGFRPEHLDELGAAGWLVWVGVSPLGRSGGRIALFRRERVGRLLLPPDDAELELDARHAAILEHLATRGASFVNDLPLGANEADRSAGTDALWDLVWAGLVTNDAFAALRSLAARG